MKKIFLIADDDYDDMELFAEALREIDDTIICYCCEDCKMLLEKLEIGAFEKPDVIFLDINLPGTNGWDCLVNLKKHDDYKAIPVIMYSTSSHPQEINKALSLGAVYFITKPVKFSVLKKLLKIINDNLHDLSNDNCRLNLGDHIPERNFSN